MTLELLHARVLDNDIQYLIRTKARQLCRVPGINRDEREDLEQELTLRLLRKLQSFNPKKASFYCFAGVVIDRVAKNLLRARFCESQQPAGVVSLQTLVLSPEGATVRFAELVADTERDNRRGRYTATEAERIDLTTDVRAVLATLSPDLRDLAQRLVTSSLRQIACDTGEPWLHLRRRLARLRKVLQCAGLKTYQKTELTF